ncbi:MAG: cyclic pyranopterin monophosphate synthase MoaC [Chloroflexota bacterium]|nr:cyclic pyranopterin monophosphate synthase MoaC [Chloroflexota bacterium]
MDDKLSHMDPKTGAKMVDVSGKETSAREAIARGKISVNQKVMDAIIESNNPKGDVLSTAKIAGIMSAKKTSSLIPLCHPINLSFIDTQLNVNRDENYIEIESTVRTTEKTGVEMEALTAVSIAALTIYDMCKALDKTMVIDEIRLIKKTGGSSGNYDRNNLS